LEIRLKNILSITIFPIVRWNSIEDDTKRQIFSDHRDYNLINEYYKELKQRDSGFSQNDISEKTLRQNTEDVLITKNFISLSALHQSHQVYLLYFSYLKFSELSSFFLFKV
jgi:hypothetical protein